MSVAKTDSAQPPKEAWLIVVLLFLQDWKALLRDFWRDFAGAVDEIGELRMGQVIEALG